MADFAVKLQNCTLGNLKFEPVELPILEEDEFSANFSSTDDEVHDAIVIFFCIIFFFNFTIEIFMFQSKSVEVAFNPAKITGIKRHGGSILKPKFIKRQNLKNDLKRASEEACSGQPKKKIRILTPKERKERQRAVKQVTPKAEVSDESDEENEEDYCDVEMLEPEMIATFDKLMEEEIKKSKNQEIENALRKIGELDHIMMVPNITENNESSVFQAQRAHRTYAKVECKNQVGVQQNRVFGNKTPNFRPANTSTTVSQISKAEIVVNGPKTSLVRQKLTPKEQLKAKSSEKIVQLKRSSTSKKVDTKKLLKEIRKFHPLIPYQSSEEPLFSKIVPNMFIECEPPPESIILQSALIVQNYPTHIREEKAKELAKHGMYSPYLDKPIEVIETYDENLIADYDDGENEKMIEVIVEQEDKEVDVVNVENHTADTPVAGQKLFLVKSAFANFQKGRRIPEFLNKASAARQKVFFKQVNADQTIPAQSISVASEKENSTLVAIKPVPITSNIPLIPKLVPVSNKTNPLVGQKITLKPITKVISVASKREQNMASVAAQKVLLNDNPIKLIPVKSVKEKPAPVGVQRVIAHKLVDTKNIPVIRVKRAVADENLQSPKRPKIMDTARESSPSPRKAFSSLNF